MPSLMIYTTEEQYEILDKEFGDAHTAIAHILEEFCQRKRCGYSTSDMTILNAHDELFAEGEFLFFREDPEVEYVLEYDDEC